MNHGVGAEILKGYKFFGLIPAGDSVTVIVRDRFLVGNFKLGGENAK